MVIRSLAAAFVVALTVTIRIPAAHAQNWTVELDTGGRDEVTSTAATPDGGCVVLGSSSQVPGVAIRGLQWLAKLDSRGDLQWASGTNEGHVELNDVAPMPDGGFLVVGSTRPSGGSILFGWIAKLNGSGVPLWQYWSGPDSWQSHLRALPLPDGGALLLSHVSKPGAGMSGWVRVSRIRPNASVAWDREFEIGSYLWCGRLVFTTDGKFAVLAASGPATGLHQVVQCAKFTLNGTMEWQRRFEEMRLTDVMPLPGGGVQLCSNSAADVRPGLYGRPGASVVELANDGAILRSRRFADAFLGEAPVHWGTSIIADGEGGWFLGSYRGRSLTYDTGDIWLARARPDGSIAWQKSGRPRDRSLGRRSGGWQHKLIMERLGGAPHGWPGILMVMPTAHRERTDDDILLVRQSLDVEACDDRCAVWSPVAVPLDTLHLPPVTNLGVQVAGGGYEFLPTSFSVGPVALTATTECFDRDPRVVVSPSGRPWVRNEPLCHDGPVRRRTSNTRIPVFCPRPGDPPCQYDPECRHCVASFIPDGREISNPGWRIALWNSASVLVEGTKAGPRDVAVLRSALQNVPTGRFFTTDVRSQLEAGMVALGWSNTRKNIRAAIPTDFALEVVGVLNRTDLDLAVTEFESQTVNAGAAVDFQGAVGVRAPGIAPGTKIALAVHPDLPSYVNSWTPLWPVATYELSTSMKARKDPVYDVSIYYGAYRFDMESLQPRLIHWTADGVEDITASVDPKNKIITGRCRELGSFAVVQGGPAMPK